MYEGPNIIESRGIVHPITREILTVGQAISMRILDVRTGRLLSSPETRQTMTIEQAAREGLIDSKLAARLTGPCGMTEDGNEVTLLEAIQRELYDAEQGLTDPAEKRIKVNIEESRGAQGMSISDALNRGRVDLERNLYILPDGNHISISEAYQKGYLIYKEIIKIKTSALSLSDAISQNLVDTSGWIVDRNSGDRFQLDVAIKNELINPNIREIVDAKNDIHITLAEAIERNIINIKQSKYLHNITKEKLSFKEASQRRLICKPMTLKDVCDNNLMTNDSKILSPINKKPLNILTAIKIGILDSDNVKCITNTTTGELLTLSDALGFNIILPDSKFRDNLTGELCTIPEAVDRGLITSVSQKSLFDIDGFRDPKTGEFVSFNIALSRGIIRYRNGETFLKAENGDFVYLEDCTKLSIVRPEVLEMFNRKIGIYDNGRELSVFDAVFQNILDPKTGYLLDSVTKKPIPFNKAVEINMITPEGAAMLNCLLNITLNLQTVTKTVKRYVTVTNTSKSQRSETYITFSEAVKQGLIDESTQTFTDPTTGIVFPIQQALDEGLLGVDKNEPRVINISDNLSNKDLVPGQVVELKITKKSFIKDLPPSPESKVQYDSQPETVKSPDVVFQESKYPHEITKHEIKTITSINKEVPTVTSLTIKKNTIELPRDGWNLRDAIQQNLFDPSNGTFIIPGTDRILNLEEALKMNIINCDSAYVIDPKTNKPVSLLTALEFKIIDCNGRYKHLSGIISMKDAINRNFIIFNQISLSETSSQRVITITTVPGIPDKMEISEVIETPPQFKITSDDQQSLEPVQITSGIIYDPSTALVISTSTGQSTDVLDAVSRGIVSSSSIKIVEPITGKRITLKEAINRGIVDEKTGTYNDSANKISFADAAKLGLAVVIGAPLVAASKVIQVVKNTMVVDPQTGEKIPMEVAYERGLVDQDTYAKYEDSIREKSPETIQQITTSKLSGIPTHTQITKPLTVGAAVSEGFITVESIQNSILAEPKEKCSNIKSPIQSTLIQIIKSQDPPKYKIKVQQDVKPNVIESKSIVLQKLRKRVITIPEAIEVGLLDDETAKMLEVVKECKDDAGNPLTLEKAIRTGIINGDKGKIIDPVHGHVLNINEALERNILDADGQDEILVPLARSLSIPEVFKQGLIDLNTGKIIHPETGDKLSLREAIICDIVDPLSSVTISPGNNVSLKEAIEKNIIDNDQNFIKTTEGPLSFASCINYNVFPEKELNSLLDISPAAMTLSVAIKQNIINPSTNKIVHPLTGEIFSLDSAIKDNFIMAIPYPQSSDTVLLNEALEKGIIDLKEGVYTVPSTKENIPLDKALEQGLVAIKPNSDLTGVVTTITETFTSQHTITTKMIDILADYVLVNANEVKNVITGEIVSMAEAREKGIVRDEKTSKEEFIVTSDHFNFEEALNLGFIDLQSGTFTHPHSGDVLTISEAVSAGLLDTSPTKESRIPERGDKDMLDLNEAFDLLYDENSQLFKDPNTPNKLLTFKEALDKKVINPHSIIYDVKNNKPITLEQATKSGLLDNKSGKVKDPNSRKAIDIKNAAKMGIIAIVAAPVLAGVAIVKGAKVAASKISEQKTVTDNKTSDKLGTLVRNKEIAPSTTEISTRQMASKPINLKKDSKNVSSELLPETFDTTIDTKASDKILFEKALISGAINIEEGTFTYPNTSETISISDAISKGIVTTSIPIESTKLSEKKVNHEMLDFSEAFDLLYEEKSERFRHPTKPDRLLTFKEALNENIINPDFVIYNIKDGQLITLKEAVNSNLIDSKSGKVNEPDVGIKLDIKTATKRGLIAVIAAPVLAGMAIVEGAKAIKSKVSELKPDDKSQIIPKQTKDKSLTPNINIEESQKIAPAPKVEIYEEPTLKNKELLDSNKSTKPCGQSGLDATHTSYKPELKGQISTSITSENLPEHSTAEQTMTVITTTASKVTTVEVTKSETSTVYEVISEEETKNVDNSLMENQFEEPQVLQKNKSREKLDKYPIEEEFAETKESLQKPNLENKDTDGKISSALLIDAERQPLRVIDEITEHNVTKVRRLSQAQVKNVPLMEAISQGHIEPKICRIIVNDIESPLTVQDALEQQQINNFVLVDVISKNCVVIKQQKPKYNLSIVQHCTPQEFAMLGLYDIEKECFLNPETGVKITFEELIYALEVFDPESILVKDLNSKSDTFIPLDDAIAKPIIDKNSGHMIIAKTGKRVPFFECVRLGWIVEKPDDVTVTEQMSIESAISEGLYNPKSGEVVDTLSGEIVPIGTAIQKGLLDSESFLIRLPNSNNLINLADAIHEGLIEIKEDFITIIETREIIQFSVAIQRGLITVYHKPISVKAAIENDLYDPTSRKFKDIFCEQLVNVGDAVERNIIHPTISEIKDTQSDEFLPLSKALNTNLINSKTGTIKDKKTGKDIPLDDALKKGLIATKSVTFSIHDIVKLGYYSSETCNILNPITGKTVSLRNAIDSKLVDPSEIKIKDDKSDSSIMFDDAVKKGLIDLDKGILTSPSLNLKDAVDKGYILKDKKPWTLQEGLVQGFYDPTTGLFTIKDSSMTLDDAIKLGNINHDALTVKKSDSGEIISLAEAIKIGIIDSKEGKAKDPLHGDKIPFTDASERGLIVPAKRKLSLPEAVFKGFYDPKSGKFSHPQTNEKLPTDRAIKKHMIDPQSTLVHISGKVMPFEFAVDKGIVDGRKGIILVGDEKVDFREAFERGILVEVRKPMSLIEAIDKCVYNEVTGLFMDPKTGKKYSLGEAIKVNLIDPHSVHIKQNKLGKWENISLLESLESGVINNKSGKIKNINSENEEISLREAFEIGLIVDSKAPISLQRALHQGLYDDNTGKIIDPMTTRKITLHEAIRRNIITPKYLCYFDKKSEKPLTLSECCRSEIVNRRNGKFLEPGSDTEIPLSEAMTLGLIVDIESAGFTLYEVLSMNMYDITEYKFIHPVSEKKLTLKEAIDNDLVNPETSLVKNILTSKYIKLEEAIANNVIDHQNSVYILPNGNKINLLDAKNRGLIVTSKKNLSLEEIIKNNLFRSDNGKIVDPNTNEFMDISKSIDRNFMNPDLTAVKDNYNNKFKELSLAIEQGDVDITKGRVLDSKSKKAYSFDIAFDKGLLVTVSKPITGQSITKRIISDSSAQKEPVLRDFTLDEAIKYELIDPETALIKDPHKNKYIPLKVGISDGIINKNTKGSFDPQTGRSKAMCITFENNLIVYKREPLSFEQATEYGHLNINTARFSDPHSNEILTLKDATTLGYIDSDTALIKDNLKKRLIKLPEAYRKGLIDSEKGNILDTETSKLNSLVTAIDTGLLMTPKKSFTLIETLDFGIYNPTTGALNDPFITTSVIDRKRLSLDEAINQGIVDPSSTVVKEPESGKIWPLVQAIEQKLVDPVAGRLIVDAQKDISLDLVKAHKKGYLLPAETRVSVLIYSFYLLCFIFQAKVSL